MSVVVEKWLDEPIIVLKPDAQMTQQELIDAWFQSAELAQAIAGSAFRIVDLRESLEPDAVVSAIRGILRAITGSPVDLSLRVSFIATTAAVSSASFSHTESWFETFDEALSYIRTIAGLASVST